MEKRIKDRFNEAILFEVMDRYRIAKEQIRPLGGFESFIYEYEHDHRSFILRIGHNLRRSADLIQGEVDWINALYAGGASVAQAIQSSNGLLVELVDDDLGGCFLATAFVKAPGAHIGPADLQPPLIERYGKLIGRMHILSERYQPSNLAWKRPDWDEPGMLDVENWLPPSETNVLRKYQALKAYLNKLSRDSDAYGLIHQDAHAGNFFVDGDGQITLFDFDDCAYSWYANDIAIVLFYAAIGPEDVPKFTRIFMTHFLRGYSKERALNPSWLKEIPYFLKLREIDLYAVIHRSFDVDNLEHPWVKKYMHGRRERIEEELPFIDFDFESLA